MLFRNRRNLFPILIACFCLVFAMPRSARFSRDYQKGAPWRHETLVAGFDFPILRSKENFGTDGRSDLAIIPYFRYSDNVAADNVRAGVSLPLEKKVLSRVGQTLQEIYSAGILPADNLLSDDLLIYDNKLAYVQKGKRVEKVAQSNLYTLEQAWDKLYRDCASDIGPDADSLLMACNAGSLIESNLIFDHDITLQLSENISRGLSATDGYVSAGTVIVKENEIVTERIAQTIESYKKEYNDAMGYMGSDFLVWIGNILVSISIVLILSLLLYFTNTGIFNAFGSLCYVIVVFLLASVSGILLSSSGTELIFAAPFTLAALYLQAFFPNRLIIPVYIVSLIPLLLFSEFGTVMFVMFVLAGIVAIFLFHWFGRGWKQFVTALSTFVVLALVYLGFYFTGLCSQPIPRVMLYLFVGSMLTVAGYPLIYLFEKVFNLVSNSRLEELCDNSNTLLRMLEQKAPGTFQHSLQVMNMGAAVARAIDASESLVRVGALYHDIGKIQNPLCFIENESMVAHPGDERYHEGLTPLQSAQDIIRHVSDGVELARRHHLPSVVESLILTHHGTSRVSFFYDKHVKEHGDETLEPEFRYKGPRPSTREQIILMLCDSCEAAARTLSDHSAATCRRFVDSIVDGKMAEGQFNDADITLREIESIKEAIVNYIVQIYHQRIAYPKRKNKQ